MKLLYLACALFVSAAEAGTLTIQDGPNSGGNNVTINGTGNFTLTQGTPVLELGLFDITRGTEIRQAPSLTVIAPDSTALADGKDKLDFGALDIGGVKTLAVTLRNDGNKDLTDIAFTIDGPDADAFAITPSTDTLAPQTSDTATITWVARKTGPLNATLHISSSDVDHSPFDIALMANGTTTTPKLEITEDGSTTVLNANSTVDFGTVTIGSQLEKTFHVRNLSSAPVRLSSTSVHQPYDYQPYDYNGWGLVNIRLDAPGFYFTATTPSTIAPGAKLDFKLRFQPSTTGTTSRTVTLTTQLGTEYVAQTFKVTGIGSPYVPMPLALAGLHYRMGEDQSIYFSPSRPSRAVAPAAPPAPLTASWNRWSPSGWPDLITVGNDGDPSFVPPTGAPSVDSTGSTLAASFANGFRYLARSVQLPAADNVGMELWARAESLTDGQCIAFVGDAGPDAGFGLYVNGGRLEGRVGAARLLSNPIAVGDWQHVSLIAQNGQATLRIDGVVVGDVVAATLPAVVKSLGVGGIATTTDGIISVSDAFTGLVDELRFFDVPPGGFLPDSQLLASAKPHAGVSQSAINFGTLMAGNTPTSSVDLLNHGPGWLAVEAEIIGPDAADFALSPLSSPKVIGYDVPPNPWGINFIRFYPYSSDVVPSPTLPHSLSPNLREALTVRMNASTGGPRSATLRITTSDADHPTFDIPITANLLSAQPSLAFDPAWIDFGTVLTNSYGQSSVTIQNKGTQPLSVTPSMQGPNAGDFTIPSAPVSVAANSSATLTLDFQPQGPGGRIASLHLLSNDPDHPVIDIPLYGVGQTPVPHLSVNAYDVTLGTLYPTTPLDFGSILEGGHVADRNLQFVNSGTATVTDLVATIEGSAAADYELITKPTESVGRSGGVCYSLLRFTPHGDGARNAVLRITSSDPNANPLLINLTGTGLPAAPKMRVTDGSFPRFGTGVIGGDARQTTLHVINEGTLPLTDLTARFTGLESEEFSATVPNNIAVNATGDIRLSFNPASIGPRSATLRLASSAAGTHLDLTVGGTGAHGPEATLSAQPVANWVGTALLELPNGNVLMAGYTDVLGFKRHRIREIQPDGLEINRILPSIVVRGGGGSGPHVVHMPGQVTGAVASLAVQADGKLLYTGDGVHRLLAAGSAEDPAFHPPTGDFQGHAIVALPDGKILVGGEGSLGGRARLIRLNADGSLDTTFTIPEPDGVVNALALQADGKVIVGGEFTNIDPAPTTLWSGDVFPGPGLTDGLFRLNADGTLDNAFHNSTFEKVTTLATRDGYVAVGGLQQQIAIWMTNYVWGNDQSLVGNGPTSGTSTFDQPMAALLGSDGSVIAQRSCSTIPTAVAVQPGARMLTAPGEGNSYDVRQRSTVSLLQADTRLTEWFGSKLTSDVLPALYTIFQARTQLLDGGVNALLAQDDGKVLVAGSLTNARVETRDAWTLSLPVLQPNFGTLEMRTLPAATLLNGFVQLDVDGFYNQPLPSPTLDSQPLSDGLSTLDLGAVMSTATQSLDWSFMTNSNRVRAEIVGPDFDAFTVSVSAFASDLHTAVVSHNTYIHEGPAWKPNPPPVPPVPWLTHMNVSITATPKHFGPARATLRLVPQIADADGNLTDDLSNPFEIALVANGVPALSPNVVPIDSTTSAPLHQGQELTFAATLGDLVTRAITFTNTGTTAIPVPKGSIDGPDAADFQFNPGAVGSLSVGKRLISIIVFKPSTVGTKRATLHLSTPGMDGFPLDIHLTGIGQAIPVIESVTPDQLIAKGSPTTLTVTLNDGSGDSALQWFKDGTPIPQATETTFIIPTTGFANVGTYRVKLTHSQGSELSDPIRLVVYDPLPTVTTLKVGSLFLLHCNAKGPGKLSYEWYHGDTLIPRAQRAVFFISKVSPADAGSYHCRVTMGNGAADTGLAVLNVLTGPTVQPIPPTQLVIGAPVHIALNADQPVRRWSVKGLPSGLKLDAATGMITGTPTQAGTFTVTIVAHGLLDGPPYRTALNVIGLHPSLRGTYEVLFDRGQLTEGLGGMARVTVSGQGSFTGLIKLASQDLDGNGQGKLRVFPISGTLITDATQEFAQTEPKDLSGMSGTQWFIECQRAQPESGTPATLWVHVGEEGPGSPVWRTKAPSNLVRRYQEEMTMLIRETPRAITGLSTMTVTIGANANVAWVARVNPAERASAVVTGATNLQQSELNGSLLFAYFGLSTGKEGARSLIGWGFEANQPQPSYRLESWFYWGGGNEFWSGAVNTEPMSYFGFGP